MARTFTRFLILLTACLWGIPAYAQGPTIRLNAFTVTDTLSSNGDAVTLTAKQVAEILGGVGTVKVQTLDSYSGTWEVQCSLDGSTFDAGIELTLKLLDSSTTALSVTDAVGIWEVTNAAACAALRVIATAGFAATDTVVVISATQSGGGGGGGGSGGSVTITDGTDTALVTAGGDLQVTCATCSGTGVSANEDSAFADAQATAPAGMVRQGTPANTSGTDGDVEPLRGSAGRLWTSTVLTDGTDLALIDGSGNLNIVGTVTATATNLDVQSGGADLATTTQAGAIQTAVELIDNAISGAGFNITQLAGATTPMTTTQADGLAYTLDALNVAAFLYIDNGVTFDKWDGAVTQGGTWSVSVASMPSNSTVNLTQYLSAAVSETNPVAVRISNGTTFPTLASDSTFGTTTYTEASSTGPVVGGIRNDTLDALANTTNEASPLQVDALGALWTRTLDPCSGVAKTFIPFDITTATTTELTPSLAGASTHYYICALNIVTDAANDVSLVDDDTDNCASVTSGLAGGLTAAEGWAFAANGGMTLGNGGSSVMRTVGANRVLCLVTGAATQLAGQIVVVAAP